MALQKELFPIKDRWSGDTLLTAEIECEPDEAQPVKLGLAVRWAVSNRASLDEANLCRANLDGANLDGAKLDGANLAGANLDRANLCRANLCRASLYGAKLDGASFDGASLAEGRIAKRLIARAARIHDDYEAFLFTLDDGSIFGRFGCRAMTLDDFAEHVATYNDDDPRKDESEAIISYFRTVAARHSKTS